MTGCVFYIVDALLDFGLEHNRNLNELILYFLFYYLDSFSLINFRSVSCGEGSLSPLWQMSLFRRSGGEKKWQDSSWDPCHCRRKKSRAPTLCKTFQYTVHSWRCRHCYQRGNVWGISPFFAPSFQPVTPEPELLYFRSLRPANVFERICTPWYKSAYIRVWTTPFLYRAVHISEFQCNFANDGCFWDLSFIHSLNLRSKAFRNSAWWTRRRNLSIFAMFLFSSDRSSLYGL